MDNKNLELTLFLIRKKFITAAKESLPEDLWSDFIDHPFVLGIADGTLPIESFIYYLKQDYLYLQHYARAAALAAFKCKYDFNVIHI
jgi:hydroxymethylpyrimidine/phosphomethylpyrimidine kinase